MLTGDIKYLIGGALLQAVLMGILGAVVHPHLTKEAVICAALLLAAEIVVWREIRGMKTASARAKRVAAGRRQPQS